jgi:hypothetical protein
LYFLTTHLIFFWLDGVFFLEVPATGPGAAPLSYLNVGFNNSPSRTQITQRILQASFAMKEIVIIQQKYQKPAVRQEI